MDELEEPLEIAALFERFAPPGAGKAMALRIAVRRAVSHDLLRPMDELPSTRRAAEALRISRNSVIEAYEGLNAEGVIETRRGARPRISALPDKAAAEPDAAGVPLSSRGQALSEARREGSTIGDVDALAPGLPDPDLFPRDAWATCLRRAAREARQQHDMYAGFEGLLALREALAAYLRRSRGVSVSPEQILITPGTQGGLALLADLFTDPGDAVLMEDPGYAGGRAIFEARGLVAEPLADPIEPRAVRPSPRLIYTTPSTQYPTGSRMKLSRRLEILALAHAHQALILEDDYDGDFVWKGVHVPPIFALDTADTVALLGTVSKSMLPGLRLGWILVPRWLVGPVREAHRTLGCAVNVQVQAALADFIRSGRFARHLRGTAKVYQRRMETLNSAIRLRLGNSVAVSSPDGGLQTLVRIETGLDDRLIAERLWQRGFQVLPLSRLCIRSQDRGLVVGFARADAAKAERFAEALSAELRAEGTS